ncbi:MAG: hypothetical protein LBV26_06795 [Bacteroidales bacterium]|jgi:hypothetical protein|nr:hypothetical protein [Bacteroidales bacterium]
MKIIRVFPRQTNATPTDEDVRINAPPSLFDEADEVHISVAFTWDIPQAEFLYSQWSNAGFNTKMGGPAFNEKGGDFIPGMYLKKGYVITSRGCNNNCWFCSVPRREGNELRELPITAGWNILDDNLLACSESHKSAVFEMLKRQAYRPQFTGGLEAKILTKKDAARLFELKPVTMFFAYDEPADYEPLIEAGKLLRQAGFKSSNHQARCYVLCGYRGDTFDKAERRMYQAWEAGFFPFAMLYRDFKGEYKQDWKQFQRQWANPFITATKLKERAIA